MITGTRFRLTAEINRQSRLAADLVRVQTEIATNKRIQAPSDDPAAAAQLSDLRRGEADREIWAANASGALSLSDRASSEMSGVASMLNRVNELVLSATSETTSPADRTVIANELREIALDIVSIGTRTDTRGQALFPRGTPIAVPIGSSLTVTATQSYEAVFETVETDDGPRPLVDIIRDAAAAVEIADPVARAAERDRSIRAVGKGIAHMIGVIGTQGVLGGRLEDASEQLENAKLALASERGGLEAIDLTDATLRLNALRLTLDAAQSSFIAVNRQTLFSKLA